MEKNLIIENIKKDNKFKLLYKECNLNYIFEVLNENYKINEKLELVIILNKFMNNENNLLDKKLINFIEEKILKTILNKELFFKLKIKLSLLLNKINDDENEIKYKDYLNFINNLNYYYLSEIILIFVNIFNNEYYEKKIVDNEINYKILEITNKILDYLFENINKNKLEYLNKEENLIILKLFIKYIKKNINFFNEIQVLNTNIIIKNFSLIKLDLNNNNNILIFDDFNFIEILFDIKNEIIKIIDFIKIEDNNCKIEINNLIILIFYDLKNYYFNSFKNLKSLKLVKNLTKFLNNQLDHSYNFNIFKNNLKNIFIQIILPNFILLNDDIELWIKNTNEFFNKYVYSIKYRKDENLLSYSWKFLKKLNKNFLGFILEINSFIDIIYFKIIDTNYENINLSKENNLNLNKNQLIFLFNILISSLNSNWIIREHLLIDKIYKNFKILFEIKNNINEIQIISYLIFFYIYVDYFIEKNHYFDILDNFIKILIENIDNFNLKPLIILSLNRLLKKVFKYYFKKQNDNSNNIKFCIIYYFKILLNLLKYNKDFNLSDTIYLFIKNIEIFKNNNINKEIISLIYFISDKIKNSNSMYLNKNYLNLLDILKIISKQKFIYYNHYNELIQNYSILNEIFFKILDNNNYQLIDFFNNILKNVKKINKHIIIILNDLLDKIHLIDDNLDVFKKLYKFIFLITKYELNQFDKNFIGKIKSKTIIYNNNEFLFNDIIITIILIENLEKYIENNEIIMIFNKLNFNSLNNLSFILIFKIILKFNKILIDNIWKYNEEINIFINRIINIDYSFKNIYEYKLIIISLLNLLVENNLIKNVNFDKNLILKLIKNLIGYYIDLQNYKNKEEITKSSLYMNEYSLENEKEKIDYINKILMNHSCINIYNEEELFMDLFLIIKTNNINISNNWNEKELYFYKRLNHKYSNWVINKNKEDRIRNIIEFQNN